MRRPLILAGATLLCCCKTASPFVSSFLRTTSRTKTAQGSRSMRRSSELRLSTAGAPMGTEQLDTIRKGASSAASELCRVVCVAPAAVDSRFKWRGRHIPWHEVMQQLARRLAWTNPAFSMDVFEEASLADGGEQRDRFEEALGSANIFFAAHVSDTSVATYLSEAIQPVPTRLSFASSSTLQQASKLGGLNPYDEGQRGSGGVFASLLELLGAWGSGSKKDEGVWEAVESYFERGAPEDITFLLLSLIHAYVTPVEQVQGLGKKAGLNELKCMCTKCTSQIVSCVSDPDCKACLDCLEACPPNDQVCAYRCITSYESEKFEQFALCILQKNNCMGNTATTPMLPEITPMKSFRKQPMTFEIAEKLFIGWLGRDPAMVNGNERPEDPKPAHSWKVVAGLNAAYDQFNCQYQIFYKGKGKTGMWYDPVFRVETLAGEKVWRRRHYRVKRGTEPATFHFSVLDNGVTSQEYWRIVHVEDDLSWGVFYYSGAAKAAGQAYSGALVVTPTGNWPEEKQLAKVEKVLGECGIEAWEMFAVDNSQCQGTVLGIPEEFRKYNTLPVSFP